MSDEKLRAGIAAFQAGDVIAARALLSEVVQVDALNEAAWLWLSASAESVAEKKAYLARALSANPNNDVARSALHQLELSEQRAQPLPPRSDTNTVATLTIVLLVLLGGFWLTVAICQWSFTGITDAAGTQLTLMCLGLWNIVISVLNLATIRDVIKRHKVAVLYLSSLAILGSVWGIISIALGAWLNVCAVPLYVILGVLALVNKDYYTELTPRQRKALLAKGGPAAQ